MDVRCHKLRLEPPHDFPVLLSSSALEKSGSLSYKITSLMKSTTLLAVFCSTISLALTPPSDAADLYWDANGATAGTGGTGTWNGTSTTTWRNGSETGGFQAWSSTAPDMAWLGGTAGTITLGSAITAGGVQMLSTASGDYTIKTLNGTTTNLLTLGANAPVVAPAGKTLSFTGPASGAILGGTTSTTAIFQGGGTINLTGTNRVFAGILRATGTGTTLIVTGTNALDSGSASTGLESLNGAVIRVNGTSNYRRAATLDGGTLECANIRSFQAQTNNILTINGTSGKRSIVANAKTGEIGGLAGNGNTSRSATVNVTNDPGGIDLEYQAGWRNGTLNKLGAGTLLITPTSTFNRSDNYTTANTSSYALSVNAGTVINEGTIMSPAAVTATGVLRSGATTGVFDQIDINGGVFELSRITGLFNPTFTHATGKSDINLGGGTLRYATGFTEDASALIGTISTSSGVDTNGNDITFATPLSATGTLAKKGSGSLTLAGTHTLANLAVEAGTLKLAPGSSLTGTTVTLKGTGQLDAGAGTTFTGTVLASEFVAGGRGITDVTGNLTVATGSTVRPGGADNDSIMSFGGNLTLDGVYEVDLTPFTPGLDKIEVAGDLDVSKGLFAIRLSTANPSGGVIASYGGTLTGTPKIGGFIADSRYAPTLVHNPTAKTIELAISGVTAPLALTWNGSEGGAWDLATTQKNFTRTTGGTADTFKQLDLVTFGDVTGSSTVVLTGELAPGTLSFNHGIDYTIEGNGSIAGIASLVKEGNGTLRISTDNSYSGGTTITAGKLVVGNGGTTGTLGSGPVVNDTSLTFNRSANLTIPNAISGTGSVQFQGGATFTLTEANTYGGGTTVLAGTLKQGKAGAIPTPATGSATVTVASGATLDLGGFALAGTAAQPVVVSGPGTSPTQGAVVNSGTALASSGVSFLTLAGDTAIGSDGNRFDLVGTAGAGGILSSDPLVPRKLTKVGSNQISLKTDNYSGVSEVVIEGGTLGVENDAFSTTTRTVTIQPTGALSLWGGRTLANPFVIQGGTLRADNATTNLVSGNILLNSTSTFAAAASTALTASGVISGTGGLIKDGAGDLTLNNANTYTGDTKVVSTGRLFVGNDLALGETSTIELAGGAGSQLTLATPGLTLSRPILIKSGGRVNEGLIYANQAGTTTLSGDVTISGAHNAGGTFGSLAGTELVITGKVTQTTLGLDPLQPTLATPVRVAARNGSIRFDNPANDFRWLYLSESVIKIGANNGLSTAAVVSLGDNANAATFDLNGFNQEVRSLSRWTSTGTTTIRNTGTTPSNLTFRTDFSDMLQIETALAVGTAATDGTVTVTVTGADFAAAPVVLEVPVLAGDSADAWAAKVRTALAADPAISATHQAGGTANHISLTRKTGAANDATLNIALANGTTSPGITADATSENALPGVIPTYAGAITGDTSLRKTGPETLTVSGTFTHTGTTVVDQGKLVFNATHTGGGEYTIATGATLAGSGNTASSAKVDGTLSPGDSSTLGALRTGSLQLNNGSSLALNVNSTDIAADYLRAEGSVTVAESVALELTDTNPNATLPIGSRLLLIGYTGAWSGTLLVNGKPAIDDSTVRIGPNSYRIDYNDAGSDTTSAVTLTAVADTSDPFATWIAAYPSIPEGLRTKGADADGDGAVNLVEFALGSDPSANGSSPRQPTFLSPGTGAAKHLAISTLVRTGAGFAGSPPTATIDGVSYRIEGSEQLATFDAAVEPTANPDGLPTAPAGYEYKSFRLIQPTSGKDRGFLRAKVSEATP